MRIIIFGGFLGSGKTSIILQMAKHIIAEKTDKLSKVVIVENEIGEVSVDDKVLRNTGYKVETMFSGCVCCTMSGELAAGISDIIRELNPDWIIMEATGVAYPVNIKEILMESLDIDSRICCVIDAKRWKRLLKPMEMLLKDQLREADAILINKVDAVDAATLKEVELSAKTFNNSAKYFHISAAEGIDDGLWQEILGEDE